eukprot:11140186-Lingulodinium_polyedra.AAC.1
MVPNDAIPPVLAARQLAWEWNPVVLRATGVNPVVADNARDHFARLRKLEEGCNPDAAAFQVLGPGLRAPPARRR